MRDSMRRAAAATFFGLILLCGAPLAWSQAAGGDAPFPPGEISDVLKSRIGKQVTLLLRSGKDYGGTVAEVRGQSVVIKSIAGKEFYDALVRLDDISAIEIKNR